MSNNEQQADDPSGPGWREVGPDELLQTGDMFWKVDHWEATQNAGTKSYRYGTGYRRRIEQQQPSNSKPSNSKPSNSKPSNSKPKTVHDLRRRLAECEVLLAEAERSGEQVNTELQQLRQQVQKLERELKAERDSGMTALRSQNRLGQEALAEALQTWLRPVIELVAEHPEDASPLAVAVLGFLPGIASRLIEE
jgi:hypothetical protein